MKFSPLAWAQQNVDKVAHASVSFAIMTLLSLMLLDVPFGLLISFAVTLVIGLLKEWHDAVKPHGTGWSNADVVADLVGILVSLVSIGLLFGF
jgi:hypothetical protein